MKNSLGRAWQTSPPKLVNVRQGNSCPSGVRHSLHCVKSSSSISRFSIGVSGVSFMVRTVEMFVPLEGLVDTAEELAKLEAALDYQEKFLASVRKKLSNERFVANAPEQVVAVERKKESDSLSKIESLKAAIAALKA